MASAGEGGKVLADSDLGARAGMAFASEGGKVVAKSANSMLAATTSA